MTDGMGPLNPTVSPKYGAQQVKPCANASPWSRLNGCVSQRHGQDKQSQLLVDIHNTAGSIG
jgi:hypothetical protein